MLAVSADGLAAAAGVVAFAAVGLTASDDGLTFFAEGSAAGSVAASACAAETLREWAFVVVGRADFAADELTFAAGAASTTGVLTGAADGLAVAAGAAASGGGVLTGAADGLAVAAGAVASAGGVLTGAADGLAVAAGAVASAGGVLTGATDGLAVAAGAAASGAGVVAAGVCANPTANSRAGTTINRNDFFMESSTDSRLTSEISLGI